MAPPLDHNDSPFENLSTECRCCTQGSRYKMKADSTKRSELEQQLRDKGLFRPYRKLF